MSNPKQAVGRVGYVWKLGNDAITLRDFDRLVVDLNAGAIDIERNGSRVTLPIEQLHSIQVRVPGLRTKP